MRTSALIAAALAGVVSAWPKFSGTASAITGGGGIYPTGGGIYPTATAGYFPSSSGAATYTGLPYSTGKKSYYPSGATGSGQIGPTGTGNGGGSGSGQSTLVPTTITYTSDVPTTTTSTIYITNTITTTISKFFISPAVKNVPYS